MSGWHRFVSASPMVWDNDEMQSMREGQPLGLADLLDTGLVWLGPVEDIGE